jgi:hypothetical protein
MNMLDNAKFLWKSKLFQITVEAARKRCYTLN